MSTYESSKSGMEEGSLRGSVKQLMDDGYRYYCRWCEQNWRELPVGHNCEYPMICHLATGYVVGAQTMDGREL